MYVIKELRLNRFKDVRIPSAKDLYQKLGLRAVSRPGNVGKDGAFEEPVNTGYMMSKQDSLTFGQLEMYRQYSESMRQEASGDADASE